MIEVDFSSDFLFNFNDSFKDKDFPKPALKALSSCIWNVDDLERILKKFLNSNDSDEISDVDDVLLSAITLALVFVQCNFTGDFKSLPDFKELVTKTFPDDYNAASKLMVNGEELNLNVQIPEFLHAAKELLKRVEEMKPKSLIVRWWKLRLLWVHQSVLDELTTDLYDELKEVSEFLLTNAKSLQDVELNSLLKLEVASGYLLFHRTQKCEEVLTALCSELNVELAVEGVLGLRTKFQNKPLPQLCLKVLQETELNLPPSNVTNGSTVLPKLFTLDEPTLLAKIKFLNEEDNHVMSLPSILQVIVLTKAKLLKRSQPIDRLTEEELEPYINTLLYQDHGPLPVRLASLLLNIDLESNSIRKVDRSFKQCGQVLNVFSASDHSLPERLSYGFASFVVPEWEVEMQLGDLMASLGMNKTALNHYTKIQAWEKVIECYTKLELRDKAAEIIRQELEKKPTVLLHCLLGDATDDVKCYETAWEISNHTSARAQSHWGNYFFARKEYANALPHLERSVEINALQEKIWMRLGYAAIMVENWSLAVHAYITYTHLEPQCYESWNNLAKALIKLGDKPRAHRVLGEAIKCNYQNWKVWENFLLVSVDTGNFEDVINAYTRLSEMKDRYLDMEVLTIVVTAIANGTPDAQGKDHKRLVKKATTLLGHQCVTHGFDFRLWELSAMLAETPLHKAQKLQRAHRSFVQKDEVWPTKQQSSLKVLQLCKKISELTLQAVENHDESENSSVTSQVSSAMFSAQACVRAVEKEMEKWDENEKILAELKELVEKLTSVVKQRKP